MPWWGLSRRLNGRCQGRACLRFGPPKAGAVFFFQLEGGSAFWALLPFRVMRASVCACCVSLVIQEEDVQGGRSRQPHL